MTGNVMSLHVEIQYSKHVSKRLSPSQCLFAHFVKYYVTTAVWVYCCVPSVIPFVHRPVLCQYHDGFVTMAPKYNLKSTVCSFSLEFLWLLSNFTVHMNFRNIFPTSVKNVIGILMRSTLNLYTPFDDIAISAILIQPIQKSRCSHHVGSSSSPILSILMF